MKPMLRALAIVRTASRHGLDEWLPASRAKPFVRLFKLFSPTAKAHREQPRGVRLRLALQELGPLFVKLGQVLSTRRDLLPADIADELAALRDQVKPFDSREAKAIVAEALGKPLAELFERFDDEPLASASIAQVHAAWLPDGRAVVVKVLRPGIEDRIGKDIALMRLLADGIRRLHPNADKIRPHDVVAELETTLLAECDLQREAANASQLRRNFAGSEQLYVPQVYWDLCRPKVLVMERIYGVAVTDLATLADQRTDMKLLAERGVEIFFTQVFRDSFFHADMHPGNIFVSTRTPWSPQYIAIDCGIVGSLPPEDQDSLARNLIAFFKRDYRRVAQLHIDSGWVPADTKVNDFEAAIRTVCEPIFEKPLKDISFGQLLLRLFQTARRFNMEIQPQLVLLQKTLLNIEGLGRQLYPDLDLWNTAQPFLERWMRERISPRSLLRNLQQQAEQVPHLSQMARDTLERLNQQGQQPVVAPVVPRHWPAQLLGAALIGGAVSQGLLLNLLAWPSWLMLAGGLYLVLRR